MQLARRTGAMSSSNVRDHATDGSRRDKQDIDTAWTARALFIDVAELYRNETVARSSRWIACQRIDNGRSVCLSRDGAGIFRDAERCRLKRPPLTASRFGAGERVLPCLLCSAF